MDISIKNKIEREQYEKRTLKHLKPNNYYEVAYLVKSGEKTPFNDLVKLGGF